MMGFFSYNCNSCQHPMLSEYATNPINDWMRQVVVIEEDGTILLGEWDGYGRVDQDMVADPMEVCCYHFSCWLIEGKPLEYKPSLNAPDQGYFFGNEHNMPEPKGGE